MREFLEYTLAVLDKTTALTKPLTEAAAWLNPQVHLCQDCSGRGIPKAMRVLMEHIGYANMIRSTNRSSSSGSQPFSDERSVGRILAEQILQKVTAAERPRNQTAPAAERSTSHGETRQRVKIKNQKLSVTDNKETSPGKVLNLTDCLFPEVGQLPQDGFQQESLTSTGAPSPELGQLTQDEIQEELCELAQDKVQKESPTQTQNILDLNKHSRNILEKSMYKELNAWVRVHHNPWIGPTSSKTERAVYNFVKELPKDLFEDLVGFRFTPLSDEELRKGWWEYEGWGEYME